MADFDLFRVKVKFRFFYFIEKIPPLTKRRRLRYCASKSVQPFRLYPCQNVKVRKKLTKKKKEKKAQTLICCVYVPQSLKISPKPNFARSFRSMT